VGPIFESQAVQEEEEEKETSLTDYQSMLCNIPEE
jgi:hypothetical protein